MDTNHHDEENKVSNKPQGVAYPVITIADALESAKVIINEIGSSKPISKDQIASILNKKTGTLNLYYSTLVQYGIFSLVHGKGYLPSELYRKYVEPIHSEDEIRAKMAMFKSPPLYAKVIENLNNHQLPADEKRLANLLKSEPYNVNPSSSERAAKVLYENTRDLNLLDFNRTLKFGVISIQPVETAANQSVAPIKKDVNGEEDLFELPIPLPNKRKAYLRYPIENLTKRDINVISKALEFIASSLDEET